MVASDDESTRNVPNYYFRTEVIEERLDPPNSSQSPVTVVEAWHLDRRWRWQFWQPHDEGRIELWVMVVDGDTLYSYDAGDNNYYSEIVPDNEALSVIGNVGFAPAESITEFIEQQALSKGFQSATEKGSETVLGRSVKAVEVNLRFEGPGSRVATDEVRLTYWIEPESMLVLASELVTPRGKHRHEIVELRLDEPIDEESLLFEPPADARLVDPPPFSAANLARYQDNNPDVPPGFLTPEHLPAGYELTSRETENLSNDEPTTLALTFEAGTLANGAIQEIEIEQTEAVGDLPAWTQGALQVNLDGHDAYALELDYSRQITWIQDGLQILIRANDIPIAELLLIGESLR